MKKGNFGAFCPHCEEGTMVASALANSNEQFFLFYITSEGNICFDGICSNCQGQFQMSYPIMELLFQCPLEEDKVISEKPEVLHVFKKLSIF